MKFKKLLTFIPVLAFALTACGGQRDVTGTYSFQLGTKEGTHAAIHIELTNTPYYDGQSSEVESNATSQVQPKADTKLFNLIFDIAIKGKLKNIGDLIDVISTLNPTDFYDEDSSELTSSETSSAITSSEQTSGESSSEENKPITISGYYYLGDETEPVRLYLGILLFDKTYEIDPQLIELLMYAVLSGDTINIYVPVSIKDLQYQLYWYGWRISTIFDLADPTDLTEENPALKHNPIGSHPTQEDIDYISAYEKERKEKGESEYGDEIFEDFRDYYTLNMGLTKNG